jgi:hypothetical protein
VNTMLLLSLPRLISRELLIATRRQVIQDVTRRQGFASRCSRCADTGPGARVIIVFLAAAGMCGVGAAGIASSRGCGGPAHGGLSEAPRSGCGGCVLGA